MGMHHIKGSIAVQWGGPLASLSIIPNICSKTYQTYTNNMSKYIQDILPAPGLGRAGGRLVFRMYLGHIWISGLRLSRASLSSELLLTVSTTRTGPSTPGIWKPGAAALQF